MKTLCLLRHAKSSWDNDILDDFDRPLNPRGKKDAPVMAMRLRDYAFFPQTVLASPAKRTRKTAKIFADSLGYPRQDILFSQLIYEGALEEMVELLRGVNDESRRVMLVGHNPYITILAEWLSGRNFGNVPTCGMVGLEFPIDSWRQLSQGGGGLLFYDYPKNR